MIEKTTNPLKILRMDSFSKRLTGAITRPINKTGQILLFIPGGSIHTFFMKYDLHIFFLGTDYQLLSGHPNVKPWRVIKAPKGTCYVAESASNLPYDLVHKKLMTTKVLS